MKIPIGIFFGGATPARDRSFQIGRRIYEQLDSDLFTPLAILVDPFGQLILLDEGWPSERSMGAFYPSEDYFSAQERHHFPRYPEQLGELSEEEQRRMAEQTGRLIAMEDLPQLISLAFLALPDVADIRQTLDSVRIPYTGETKALLTLIDDRLALRRRLQQLKVELPAAIALSADEWKENSLQAIWGEHTASVAYPLLLRPSHQFHAGRSSVVLAKDGPNGLRRAIDQAFGQRRLSDEDWLDMSPVDRENFVRYLASWESGVGFPLQLQTDELTISFLRPEELLEYLNSTTTEFSGQTLVFKADAGGEHIVVSTLPEGTAVSCLLLKNGEKPEWQPVDVRLLGSAPTLADYPQERAFSGVIPKLSDSMAEQVVEEGRKLATQLGFQCAVRLSGILTPTGKWIPEEVQAYYEVPPEAPELSLGHLTAFIMQSLRVRYAETSDAAYRSVLETLEALAEQVAVPVTVDADSVTVINAPPPSGPPPPPPPPAPTKRESNYAYEPRPATVPAETTYSAAASPSHEPLTETEPPTFWSRTKKFLTSKIFLRNLAAILVTVLLLFFLLTSLLHLYTRHGDSMQLEDYNGLLLQDAQRKAAARGLKISVMGSKYSPTGRPGEIYAQYPKPLSQVKENRTIYVQIFSEEGQMRTLPPFTTAGDDLESYRRELHKLNVNIEVQDQVFDAKLAEGTILHLLVDGQKVTNTDLRRGKVEVQEGATVAAVVSTRTSNLVEIPNLLCKTFDEASFHVNGLNLSVGRVYGSVPNQSNAFVWKQEPAYGSGKLVRKGSKINLYITATRPDACE